jgi:predicted alpha-1,2-mannosidase
MFTAPEQDYSGYVRTDSSALGLTEEQTGGYGDGKSGLLIEYVDPFIGTAGHGHTFPGAATPFGMVQVSPDNGIEGWDWCSGYNRYSNEIEYFSHKHLSGTGCNDLGDIGVMPSYTGAREFYRFNHDKEFAYPGYYAVELDSGIIAEMTASARTAVHRYTYTKPLNRKVDVNLYHYIGGATLLQSSFEIIDEKTIAGFRFSAGWAPKQRVYFVIRFSEPFINVSQAVNRRIFSFGTSDKPIELRVALSSVGIDGAMKNLEAESADLSFDQVRENAVQSWEKELNKIKIEVGSDYRKSVFYTAVYHSYIAPALYSDVDGKYSEPDGSVTQCGDYSRYSTLSLWDTYRAAHPLFVLTQPQLVDDFIQSMLDHYKHRGFLPIWELEANENYCMIGNHSIPVIAEAYVKGIRTFNAELALEACIKTADQERKGLKEYQKYGYVPFDKQGESVSITLEYAYDDYCVAVFAEALGKTEIADKYYKRAQNYRNLFDKESGLMRPKNSNGKWLENFDPLVHDVAGVRHYTEGNAWQYSWAVQHDIDGLISLYGSEEAFLNQFDKLFTMADDTADSHKLVDVTGLIGQYAHGNEPSHHTAFLYNWTSKSYRTQELTTEIVNKFYTDKPDGICGNEDCGQMSAWYVFTSLGFYPVDPASGEYQITTPVFQKTVFNLPGGKTLTVEADKDPEKNIYIDYVELNGTKLDKSFITYDQIMAGGSLKFFLKDSHK